MTYALFLRHCFLFRWVTISTVPIVLSLEVLAFAFFFHPLDTSHSNTQCWPIHVTVIHCLSSHPFTGVGYAAQFLPTATEYYLCRAFDLPLPSIPTTTSQPTLPNYHFRAVVQACTSSKTTKHNIASPAPRLYVGYGQFNRKISRCRAQHTGRCPHGISSPSSAHEICPSEAPRSK
jgi:hypothetical protein